MISNGVQITNQATIVICTATRHKRMSRHYSSKRAFEAVAAMAPYHLDYEQANQLYALTKYTVLWPVNTFFIQSAYERFYWYAQQYPSTNTLNPSQFYIDAFVAAYRTQYYLHSPLLEAPKARQYVSYYQMSGLVSGGGNGRHLRLNARSHINRFYVLYQELLVYLFQPHIVPKMDVDGPVFDTIVSYLKSHFQVSELTESSARSLERQICLNKYNILKILQLFNSVLNFQMPTTRGKHQNVLLEEYSRRKQELQEKVQSLKKELLVQGSTFYRQQQLRLIRRQQHCLQRKYFTQGQQHKYSKDEIKKWLSRNQVHCAAKEMQLQFLTHILGHGAFQDEKNEFTFSWEDTVLDTGLHKMENEIMTAGSQQKAIRLIVSLVRCEITRYFGEYVGRQMSFNELHWMLRFYWWAVVHEAMRPDVVKSLEDNLMRYEEQQRDAAKQDGAYMKRRLKHIIRMIASIKMKIDMVRLVRQQRENFLCTATQLFDLVRLRFQQSDDLHELGKVLGVLSGQRVQPLDARLRQYIVDLFQ